MSRFAVSWSLDGRPHARDLDVTGRGEYVIGREDGVDIVVPLATVSRRQARLVGNGSQYALENLSETNVTRLGDRAIAGREPLSDGSAIAAGGAALTFHDLAAGDRVSGPRCSNCGRENASGDAECWFCGTSMVNALTGVRTRLRLVLRLVDPAGVAVDLVEGQALRPRDGGWEVDTTQSGGDGDGGAPVTVRDGHAVLVPDRGVGLEDADGNAKPPGFIATGDVLVVDDHRAVAIAR